MFWAAFRHMMFSSLLKLKASARTEKASSIANMFQHEMSVSICMFRLEEAFRACSSQPQPVDKGISSA